MTYSDSSSECFNAESAEHRRRRDNKWNLAPLSGVPKGELSWVLSGGPGHGAKISLTGKTARRKFRPNPKVAIAPLTSQAFTLESYRKNRFC